MTVPQENAVDGMFADVVTLGGRDIHNDTGLLLDKCGTGRPGANLHEFGNIGGGEHFTGASLRNQDSSTSFTESSNLVPVK